MKKAGNGQGGKQVPFCLYKCGPREKNSLRLEQYKSAIFLRIWNEEMDYVY